MIMIMTIDYDNDEHDMTIAMSMQCLYVLISWTKSMKQYYVVCVIGARPGVVRSDGEAEEEQGLAPLAHPFFHRPGGQWHPQECKALDYPPSCCSEGFA